MASSLHILMLLLLSLSMAKADLKVYDLRAEYLPVDFFGTTDAYVKVFDNFEEVGETSVKENEANPTWNEQFSFSKAKAGDILSLEVHDSDPFFDDLVGTCAEEIKTGTHTEFCLLMKGGVLHFTYSFS